MRVLYERTDESGNRLIVSEGPGVTALFTVITADGAAAEVGLHLEDLPDLVAALARLGL